MNKVGHEVIEGKVPFQFGIHRLIAVADYGLGNVGSVVNMLKYLGAEACVAQDEATFGRAEKVILPGVGAFDRGMELITSSGVARILEKMVLERGCPLLGICLGMQLLANKSEEGERPGLGWIDADVKRFVKSNGTGGRELRIPHMGWNDVRPIPTSRLFSGWEDEARFYFVHSYHVVPNDSQLVSATATYGVEFVAGIERANIFGVQFHPEKSHKFGMELLRRFIEI